MLHVVELFQFFADFGKFFATRNFVGLHCLTVRSKLLLLLKANQLNHLILRYRIHDFPGMRRPLFVKRGYWRKILLLRWMEQSYRHDCLYRWKWTIISVSFSMHLVAIVIIIPSNRNDRFIIPSSRNDRFITCRVRVYLTW